MNSSLTRSSFSEVGNSSFTKHSSVWTALLSAPLDACFEAISRVF